MKLPLTEEEMEIWKKNTAMWLADVAKNMTRETDKTYVIYQRYCSLLLEDSGVLSELPQIKEIAATLTMAQAMNMAAEGVWEQNTGGGIRIRDTVVEKRNDS